MKTQAEIEDSVQMIAGYAEKLHNLQRRLAEEVKLGKSKTTTTARSVSKVNRQCVLLDERIMGLEKVARQMYESWF